MITAALFVQFLYYHEVRADGIGWEFNDPAFLVIPRYDCSIFIFSITYGSMLYYFLTNYKIRYYGSKLMLSYGLLLIFRIVTLTILPFKEPSSLIYLEDPFLNTLIYPGNIDADLFFSGHTALIFIMYFLTKNKIFILLGILLGLMLIIQRVHYSIDVIAAVPFAYIIVRITEYITSRCVIKD